MKTNGAVASKRRFLIIILLMSSAVVSFSLVELICRFLYFGNVSVVYRTPESTFVQYDKTLGWATIPNSEGRFSYPMAGFDGYVKYDKNGIRENDNNFDYEGGSILIIGDSVTAGLEVDNNMTFSAVLERLFFENGCKYRVYNTGVRGYGTDQSYLNLKRLLEVVKPTYVIYMFNGTDIMDNKTIKQSNRKYGKPLFVFSDGKLISINSPAKEYKRSYYAFVKYDTDGYRVTEGYMNGALRTIMDFIKNNLAVYLPLNVLYNKFRISPTIALAKAPLYKDYELMELLLTGMKDLGPELYLTSLPDAGEEVYINELTRISNKLDITYLNLFPYFTEPWENYHWKSDRHWNEKGHFQAATALFELLNSSLCN